MHNGIKNTLIFVLGAAAGVAVSWKFLEKKFEKISREEIDSVKEYYSKRNQVYEGPNQSDEVEEPDTDLAKEDYEDLVNNSGYINYAANDKKEKGGNDVGTKKIEPYIITPEDFDEFDDYDAISLTYYADGMLTDDYDEPVENPDDVVGPDFADHFGEYEDDAVYVRNDRLKADYEILYDTRKYSDVKNENEADE